MYSLVDHWKRALREIVLRHPNGRSKVMLRIDNVFAGPTLYVGLDETTSTRDPDKVMHNFTISNVQLTFSPPDYLIHQWLAAAWVGYLQHEALELVTVGKRNPLDPHEEPYPTNPYNRGLRDGFPPVLTPETMFDTLTIVMSSTEARRLMVAGGVEPPGVR